jgi:alkaline phosphatase D
LRTDDLRAESPVVATEFAGTSITSGGDGGERLDQAESIMSRNPGVHFFNDQRGYVRCTITPGTWRSDFQTVDYITKPGAPVVTKASFVVEAGQAGAKRA